MWKYEELKREQKKLMYITKVLFEDMDKKDSELSELDNQISNLTDQLYSLKKKIDSKLDNKHSLEEIRDQILSSHDIAARKLYNIMQEISEIEETMVEETPKGVVNE